MAKQSGIGSNLYVGAYDLSGDVGSVSNIETSLAVKEVPAINQAAMDRQILRRDGALSFASFWVTDVDHAHAVLSALPTADVQVTVAIGTTIASHAASIVAKQSNYAPAFGEDGSLGATTNAVGSGFGLEWGQMLTAGMETFAATQAVAAWEATHDYAEDDIVQPTVPNGHYYKVTADAGSSDSSEPTWPTNGTTVVDDGITWTDQGLLPNGIDRGAASASDLGLAAYLHVFEIGSGSATIVLQDSADRIAWSDIGSAAFTAVTAATTERIQTGATENVRRYVRAYLTGTFTDLVAAINVVPR